MSDFQYDVFISYSHKDAAWVRGELLGRIEHAGLKAYIDFRDFTPGAPSIKGMARGVQGCPKTLVVLTPDYIQSEWCELEGVMAQTLSPANRDPRLIPLLKVPCQKPLHVGALTHIDFTDTADQDLAWRQLLTALGKPPELQPPKQPDRADWLLDHPYAMPPNFTGRAAEREMLTMWLNGDPTHPLFILRALGGFGKSALTWHWLLHDVPPKDWPRVIWWSFYEGDASFENFLDRSLRYLTAGDPAQLGPRQRVDALLKAIHQPGTLLILDGFERLLRVFGGLNAAYQGDEAGTSPTDRECISPFVEDFLRGVIGLPDIRGKVLLTTRLRPTPVETRDGILLQGCREEELTQLQPADAVEFFHAQGVRGTHTEIEEACALYGYHPLSMRLLAGLILNDLEQPGDIVAAKKLDISGDIKQRKHHVLARAYDSLNPARQKLLGQISCFRGAVKYDALRAVAESVGSLRKDTLDLVARGLLHHDTREGRFDLHPIVRRYAYDRMAVMERTSIHSGLAAYFASLSAPDKVTRLEDLAPMIELYHHTVRAGFFDTACLILHQHIEEIVHYRFGASQLSIDLLRALFPDGEDHPPRLRDKDARASTLAALGNAYSHVGQPLHAIRLLEGQIAIRRKGGASANLLTGLENLADLQVQTGKFRIAESNLRDSIVIARSIQEVFSEGVEHRQLGLLLAYRGIWRESESELGLAFDMFGKDHRIQSQCAVSAHHALRELLLRRCDPASSFRGPQPAIAPARRALELADEQAARGYPVERDYIRAHWLLGAAYRSANEPLDAEHQLQGALQRCRRINMVEFEADILIDLARLRAATGAPDDARRLAEEALIITERSGYVLQGADAHLELAKLALGRGDKAVALEHAREARKLATCDGPPDYTYKAAYDEAGELLKQLE